MKEEKELAAGTRTAGEGDKKASGLPVGLLVNF